MRNTRIATKKFKKSRTGKTGSTRTDFHEDVVIARTAVVTTTTKCAATVSSYLKLSDEDLEFTDVEPSASYGFSFAPPVDFDSTRSAVQVIDDTAGDDAYLRRLRLSEPQQKSIHDSTRYVMEPTMAQPASFQPVAPLSSDHQVSCSIQPTAPTISRAPVRYSLPPPQPEIPSTEAELAEALSNKDVEHDQSMIDEAPRSLRPGQQGFAERLMSKYGWTKGSGLGASGSGIVNPLRVQVEKQKKKPDAEGGGYVGPSGRGRIIGGKKGGAPDSETRQRPFGAMSEVIALHGMIDGLDLDAELERADDGGLLQEIGEECGEKVRPLVAPKVDFPLWSDMLQYGRVERVFIDRNGSEHPRVFVKFTSQLSALRVFITSS